MLSIAGAARGQTVPDAVRRLLPPGYGVIAAAAVTPPGGGRFLVVALASHREGTTLHTVDPAPARPLLLFRQGRDGRFTLAARNDGVVFRRDEGGQCDPFEGDALVAKGAFLTVQNGVACGQHWTDYVTFRFEPARQAFLFHSRIWESWRLNSSDDPDAEALVLDGTTTKRADPRRPVAFGAYRQK